jgi:3-hydroxyacyl-[acyl-carrier-protein] dehydratase
VSDAASGVASDNLVSLLPHRPPMRFLDRAWMEEAHLHARLTIPRSDPVLAGHFPDLPVWPGTLLMEAMAQTTAVWLIHARGALRPDEVPLLGAVDCTLRRPVFPGVTICFETRCLRERDGSALFAVTARFESGDVVARARISAAIRNRSILAGAPR